VSGAAPLPLEVQEAFEKLTRGKLVEGYGLTEAAPVTHANPLYGRRKTGTIGTPLPSTDARVVSLGSGQPLQPGEIGELCVRGPQVMLGYWNSPDATKQTLRDGWLHTGDLARMDEEGYFQIIDRKKDMIIAGDLNVFPRDVEEVLYEHPKVFEAAVVGVPPESRQQEIRAFIVLKKGEKASAEEFIRLLRNRLPDYKIPSYVEFREELPKTFVGKILRRALAQAEKIGARLQREETANPSG
jgi:long-chain acyl-CoA synthetase